MFHIDVFFTPTEFDMPDRKDDIVVVGVDVLRAGTTICFALNSGAKQVIPVSNTEEALNIYNKFDKGLALLAGERNCKKIDGFHLGNSPLDFVPELVSGKVIILSTTNGSNLFNKCLAFPNFFIGCFVNFSSVVEKVLERIQHSQIRRIILACSGQNNKFAFEDALFCGMFIDSFTKKFEVQNLMEMNDGARASLDLYNLHKDALFDFIKTTAHCQNLIQLGFEEDVELALTIDNVSLVPTSNGLSLV